MFGWQKTESRWIELVLTLLPVTVICGSALVGVHAQSGTPASSGVYTAQQANRGGAIYQAKCSSCHGDDLAGVGTAPAVAGPDFAGRWTGRPVAALFTGIRTSMPSDQPGTLSAQQAADLVAFLLKVNKFPAGSSDLPANADHLKSILIDDAP